MYHIETEPPNRCCNKENRNHDQKQTLPPPPLIFGTESSPTPSSDHSTLTSNSCQITGQNNSINLDATSNQSVGVFLNPQTGTTNACNKVPQINNNYDYTRHSSSSIDHKTLYLTRFADQQQNHRCFNYNENAVAESARHKRSTFGSNQVRALNRQVSAEPTDSRASSSRFIVDQHDTSKLTSAKRSNSFQQNNRLLVNPDGSFNPISNYQKRSSVNLTLGTQNLHSPTRFGHFQRHLSTPVPPPRAPIDDGEDISAASSSSRQLPLWGSRQMAAQQQLASINMMNNKSGDSQRRYQRGSNLIDGHQTNANMLSNLDQQQGTDSLDNINMIVDEENGGTLTIPTAENQLLDSDRFMFMTSDEPYKMSTLKVANGTPRRVKKAITFDQAIDEQVSTGDGKQASQTQHETEQQRVVTSASASSAQAEQNFPNSQDHVVHFNEDMSDQQQQSSTSPAYGDLQTRHQEMQNGYGVHSGPQTRHHQNQRMLVYESRKY